MSVNKMKPEELMQWYVKNRPIYSNLANKVESIIKEVLDAHGAKFYSISSRAKEIDSFVKKAQKPKYTDPVNQIQDLAGIRVITYVKSEVTKCCDIIKPLFYIDKENSVDKGNELGDDKAGYRSIHFVCTLPEERLKLPEYQIFRNMTFEIQIRTILEHAWADISHDRSYKYKGEFPAEYDIKRRFTLASATLELIDREFDSIATTLNKYELETETRTKKGEMNLPINITSVSNYLLHTFDEYIKDDKLQPVFRGGEDIILDELLDFGFKNLEELDTTVTDIIKTTPNLIEVSTNFTGLVRNIMMLHDIDNYFHNAWNRNWSGINSEFCEIARKKGIDIDDYLDEYNLDIFYPEVDS